MEQKERPKIAITLDYVLRSPDFIKSYSNLKKVILEDAYENDNSLSQNNYWAFKSNQKKLEFYTTNSIPKNDLEKDFDYTFKKYFYDEKDRLKFFEDYSFNLYGQSEVTSKRAVEFINIIQTHLADVYLFDRIHNNRKVLNTFAFLAKSGIQIKGVEFISPNDNFIDITKDKFIAVYDPYQNQNNFLSVNKATDDIKEFAYKIEKLINPNVKQ